MSWGYSIHHRNIIIIPSIFHYTILIFYYKLCTSYAIYSLRWWGSLRWCYACWSSPCWSYPTIIAMTWGVTSKSKQI
jgi:hypothetical protein